MTKKTITELKRALRAHCRAVRAIEGAVYPAYDTRRRLAQALQAAAAKSNEPLKTSLETLRTALYVPSILDSKPALDTAQKLLA